MRHNFFTIPSRFAFVSCTALLATALLAAPASLLAQATPGTSPTPYAGQTADPTIAPPEPEQPHGRKYKAPPVTSHIEVLVTGGSQNKPITNAAVIFHPLSATGKDEGSYEVKTDPDGKAVIDVIPQGTNVILQVIAPSYSTYGQTYSISKLTESLTVKMQRPRTQYSVYSTDNNGRDANVKPGVIEPAKPVVPKPPATAGALAGSAAANSAAKKDLTVVAAPTTNTTPTGTSVDTTPTTPANPAQQQQPK